MKVALIYDRVNKIGGAERILNTLSEIFPHASLYTAVYNKKTSKWADRFHVIPSFLQKFPFAKTHHEMFPFAMPFAFESFTFDNYDVVISVTSADAKGIITKPETLHICYCLTPTRYLWSHYDTYFQNSFFRMISKPVVSILQVWDKLAAKRPDYYISISKEVEKRIKKFYNKSSTVIHPPVDTDFFIPGNKSLNKEYYLVVSRLVEYKKIDIVINAFNKLNKSLVIIGSGHKKNALEQIAGSNISFFEKLTDKELLKYYQNCRALIFPQDEDFGITSVEAQSCGIPVIAYKKGGACETVKEGITGEFFSVQKENDLIKTIERFEKRSYNRQTCRKNALAFSKRKFKKELIENITMMQKQYKKGIGLL